MVTRLKLLRVGKGWSQEKTAQELGWSRQWYCLLESGRLIPTDEMKEKLEEVFNHSADFLLGSTNVEILLTVKEA